MNVLRMSASLPSVGVVRLNSPELFKHLLSDVTLGSHIHTSRTRDKIIVL